MFDLNSMSVDTDAEISGVWFDIGDGCRVKVARMNNPKYIELFNSLVKPYKQGGRTIGLSEAKQTEIVAEAMAETILVGWEKLYIAGQKVPYSTAKAREILADPQRQPFMSLIINLAQSNEVYRVQEIADDLGEPPAG